MCFNIVDNNMIKLDTFDNWNYVTEVSVTEILTVNNCAKYAKISIFKESC